MRCTYFPLPAARRIQFVSIVQRSVGSVYRNRCFDSSICAHPYAATNISSSLCATSSNRANGDHCWGELAAVRVGDDRPMDNKQRWFAPSRRTANRRRSLASTATVRERTSAAGPQRPSRETAKIISTRPAVALRPSSEVTRLLRRARSGGSFHRSSTCRQTMTVGSGQHAD